MLIEKWGWTSAASNFHIRLCASGPWGWTPGRLIFYTQFPYLLSARPDDGRLASGRLSLNCDSCLIDERVWTGIHVVRTVAAIFPYLNLEINLKLVDHWELSERAAETSGRMQAGTEASRCRGRSGRDPRHPDEWCFVYRAFERYGTSSGSWNYGQIGVQTGWHVVWTAGREPFFLDLKNLRNTSK